MTTKKKRRRPIAAKVLATRIETLITRFGKLEMRLLAVEQQLSHLGAVVKEQNDTPKLLMAIHRLQTGASRKARFSELVAPEQVSERTELMAEAVGCIAFRYCPDCGTKNRYPAPGSWTCIGCGQLWVRVKADGDAAAGGPSQPSQTEPAEPPLHRR